MAEEDVQQIGQMPEGWEQFLESQDRTCTCTLGIGGARVNFPVGGHRALEVRFSCCYIIGRVTAVCDCIKTSICQTCWGEPERIYFSFQDFLSGMIHVHVYCQSM